MMPRVSLIVSLALLAASLADSRPAGAHDDSAPQPQRVPDHVAHRPTAIPDRIILTWIGSPATTQAVTWRTDTTVETAFAELALALDGPTFPVIRTDAASTTLHTDLGPARYHTVQFSDLTPRTKYVYRVGDGANWSEWNQFTTASAGEAPFSFVYFGDAQNDIKSLWSRVVREAYRDAPRAAFLLHAGDLITSANSDGQWGEWFYASSHIHRMVPCVATPGNHEYAKVELLKTNDGPPEKHLSQFWRPMFAFPEHGPVGLEETVYWFDYQGTRIISLNSNERQQEQVQWLNDVLTGNPNKWTVLTFHHPIYSAKEGRDNGRLRDLWQPTFDKHRVDLVLQGHDHTYARTELMTYQQNVPTGVTARSPQAGTVYVVSVSGPKMYDLGRRPFMRRAAEDTQLYQIIHIDGDELRYEARTATGKLYDAFLLRKRPGEPNELIEQVPDTPENRRPQELKAAG
jgi:3',5'-cyclic AMP phosphodiesterase CpdA